MRWQKYGNFFGASKTTEMALFHVWHFKAFNRLALKQAGAVYCLSLYKLTKCRCGRSNITWRIGPGKPHRRRLHPVFDPWGEVPPVFIPRSPDFVLQLTFGLKWPHAKFGVRPLKPGGATLENVFFPLFRSFFDMPLFHFYIFLVLYSFGGLLVWSMVYKFAKGNGQTLKVMWLISLRNLISDHVFPPVCRLRTPASFWSQLVTYQIWRETVKTGRS